MAERGPPVPGRTRGAHAASFLPSGASIGRHQFATQQTGSLGILAVEDSTDWHEMQGGRCPGVEFMWAGGDDDDPASSRGWAVLEEDGSLRGHLYFHLGDDAGFRTAQADGQSGGATRTPVHSARAMIGTIPR